MITFEGPRAAERAARFLRSGHGRATVHRVLASKHLPRALADDLTQDVLGRVWVATEHRRVAVDNLEAFLAKLLHDAAVDIVRGRVRGPQIVAGRDTVDPDAEGQGWPFDAASPLDVEADALAGESLAAVRRIIHHALAVEPAAGAAALAYLTAAVDGAPLPPDCPQPAGGATAHEAAEWAALWCSGRRDCFPATGDTPPATVRKRRSRHAGRFRGLLVRAADELGLDPEGALHG